MALDKTYIGVLKDNTHFGRQQGIRRDIWHDKLLNCALILLSDALSF